MPVRQIRKRYFTHEFRTWKRKCLNGKHHDLDQTILNKYPQISLKLEFPGISNGFQNNGINLSAMCIYLDKSRGS